MEESYIQHDVHRIEKKNQTEAKFGKQQLVALFLSINAINYSIKLIDFCYPQRIEQIKLSSTLSLGKYITIRISYLVYF